MRLRRCLRVAAARSGQVGLVLGDARGGLIASSLSRTHAEEVLTVAAKIGSTPLATFALSLTMKALDLPRYGRLVLCAVGQEAQRVSALSEAAPGVTDILG